MKITNQQLKRIIKEEINKVLNEVFKRGPGAIETQSFETFDNRRQGHYGARGPQHYQALAGSTVESILNDPNIPEDHKQKLAKLFQQGPEGRKQALELMKTMGYEGVETSFSTERGPHEEIRNPFKDAPHEHDLEYRGYGTRPTYRGGHKFSVDDEY